MDRCRYKSFSIPGENLIEAAGDAIVETRADRDDQIAIVHRIIGLVSAVHAEHAEPFRIMRRKGAEAHQGGRDREARRGDEIAQQARRFGP